MQKIDQQGSKQKKAYQKRKHSNGSHREWMKPLLKIRWKTFIHCKYKFFAKQKTNAINVTVKLVNLQ